MLENQPESSIYEAISLTSMDDSSGKLIRVRETNNLYLHLARDRHWQRKWITESSSLVDLHPRQKSLNGSRILPITQWPCLQATVIEMMLRPSPSNWSVCLTSIDGQVRLAVAQDSSLIQVRLASRKKFRAMASFNKVTGIPNLVEEDSESCVLALTSSSAPQFPEMSLCLGV